MSVGYALSAGPVHTLRLSSYAAARLRSRLSCVSLLESWTLRPSQLGPRRQLPSSYVALTTTSSSPSRRASTPSSGTQLTQPMQLQSQTNNKAAPYSDVAGLITSFLFTADAAVLSSTLWQNVISPAKLHAAFTYLSQNFPVARVGWSVARVRVSR